MKQAATQSDAAPQQPAHTATANALAVPAWVEARRKNNLKLGLALGGVVLAIFLLALWKYRPL